MSKQRPILFSTDMVQAILDGRKTQTRRMLKPQPEMFVEMDESINRPIFQYDPNNSPEKGFGYVSPKCPYGQIGDLLWVRETFRIAYPYGPEDRVIEYKVFREFGPFADDIGFDPNPVNIERWRPSIHMPKAACQLWLKITNIRVERLQDITEKDAIAEGIRKSEHFPNWWHIYGNHKSIEGSTHHPEDSFRSLWQSINGNWEANPWVWVIEFENTEKP